MKKIFVLLFCLMSTFVQAQIVDIPDANLKNALVNTDCAFFISWPISGGFNLYKVDSNNDGEIQVSEAEAVKGLRLDDLNITSTEGIQYFTNLEYLVCEENPHTSLDLSSNTNLEYLRCSYGQLENLNLANCSNLTELYCRTNQLTNVNLENTTSLEVIDAQENLLSNLNLDDSANLETISVTDNPMTSLSIQNNVNLIYLALSSTQISTLDVSNNLNLEVLGFSYTQISNIDLSNNSNLLRLYAHNCQLTNIDLSNNYNLERIWFFGNPLETINIKNGSTIDSSEYNNSSGFSISTLQYVCTDDEEYDQIIELVSSDVTVNTYCSFDPGGEYYEVSGQNKFDINMNGCDDLDIVVPNLEYQITDGTNNGVFISNSDGSYSLPIPEGTHTITPDFENPSYFNVSPESVTINFPAEASPFMQDFCITANGTYNDLEIAIMPLGAAIPGFEAHYRIIYKNKGNTSLSGDLQFLFNDDVMDFVSASQAVDVENNGSLLWNYIDLVPFETRIIDVTMLLNTPTDDEFPLNSDDVLTFEAIINPISGDEKPEDNTFILDEIVVNSFDPNDKICLQGSEIIEEQVGEYVHYRIRFENTGTANAVNIVVKDDIDETKYDITTLVPLHASHNYTTRITDHKVEFIFENIQLPFDDANNDGYIFFKIKTEPTLEIGDSFDNDAEIFFDFNAPIITEDAITTVVSEELSLPEFESNSITMFPNPTKDVLYFDSISPIKGFTIYDINGRILKQVMPTGNNLRYSINVNYLAQGNYFVSVKTETSIQNYKFVKQ